MKKLQTLAFIILIILPGLSFSQVIKGEKRQAVKQATVKISSLEQVEASQSSQIKIPNKNWQPPNWEVDEKDVIYMEPVSANKTPPRASRASSPEPDTTFNGLDDSGNSIPPDVNGAAGPDHLMITLNTEVRIQDREGNNLFTTSLGVFWGSLPGFGGTFDPKILYDPYENRWIMVTPSGSEPALSRIYFAVSTTSNPLDEWHMFWIDADESNQTWFDYPSIGFNKKWITVSGNMFGNDYYRTVFVIDKMAAYNGDENPGYTRFATSQAFTLVPSITYDSVVEDQYLIATSNGDQGGNGYIKKFRLSGDVDNPVFEYQGAIGVPDPWANGAGQAGNFLPQKGSGEKINSVDSRMENVIYRNNKLWAVHHIFLPANNPQRTAVQLWELDTDGTILQRFRIDDPSNLFSFAFPTVAVNANEDIMIGHNVFSSTQYAGAGYSFQAYYDEPNTVRDYYQYKAGENPYYKTFGSGRNRWGDYSATAVDPVNDYDFWVLQEYAASPENNWGTWWAYFRPTFPPIADFEADEMLIPVGETIDFTDKTAGVPTNWEWMFEAGDPASSNLENPPGIQYNEEGTFKVKLVATNDLGIDSITKESYITTSSTLLPDVDFAANKSMVCLGEDVSFTDLSAYSPIQWEWQFDPSTVSFVNGTDETNQNPDVIFDEPGTYAVTLTVWNLNGSSQKTQFEMITAGGLIPFYKETFELDQFSDGFWTVENPDEEVTWELFEVGGTGNDHRAAGVNLKDYFKIGQRDRLISPTFNLTGMSTAVLDFQHAYAKRHNDLTDSLIVYISGDCGNSWTRVYAGGEDGSGNFATHIQTDNFWPATWTDWCMGGWGASCVSIDLSDWAGNADVRVAFETWSGFGNPIMIDNVTISQFVGLEETSLETADINIFPNPTNGNFSIVFEGEQEFTNLQIFNQLGQMVYQSDIEAGSKQLEINTNGRWQPGVCFLKVNGGSQSVTKRVVIY